MKGRMGVRHVLVMIPPSLRPTPPLCRCFTNLRRLKLHLLQLLAEVFMRIAPHS